MTPFRRFIVPAFILGLWMSIYLPRALRGHLALGTNAYDLSVFDYALWSLSHGGFAHVPFMGHSLFSHHFMPSLVFIVPLYSIVGSPATLIVLQLLAIAGAAWLLWLIARREVDSPVALALTLSFLFSRISHTAITSVFYLESFEPLLLFGLVLAWMSRSKWTLSLLTLAALGCKEDVSLYLLSFGILIGVKQGRAREGLWLAGVSLAWLAVAVLIAIPAMRGHDGLAGAFAFSGRYSIADAGASVSFLARLSDTHAFTRLLGLTGSVLFVCLFAPRWLAVAGAGIAVNLLANRDTLQGGLIGHYLWPILPWVYVASVYGAKRLGAWHKTAPRWITVSLILATVIQSPLWRKPGGNSSHTLEVARAGRAQLRVIPSQASVLAQPNVIPHLAHRHAIDALGVSPDLLASPEYVVMTAIGDLWPLGEPGVMAERARLVSSPDYDLLTDGPMIIFRRKDVHVIGR